MLRALLELAMNQPAPPPAQAPTEITQTQEPIEEQMNENTDDGETVIVRSQRLSKPFANVSFDKMDIYTNPASKADALLAVADLQFATNNNNSADIVLRGGSHRLSRVYFNDVPIYEAVRGTTSLDTTRGFSVFNTSTIKSIETYSSAPPAYFANTAGGVIRIMPDDYGTNSASLEINSTRMGFDLTRELPANNGSFVQIYGEHSNLAPLLLTNPKLEDLVTSSRGLNLGVNVFLRLNEKQELRFFSLNDIDNGLYPFSPFDASLNLDNRKRRSYNLVSFEQELGDRRLKIDLARTFINEINDFGRDVFTNINQYSYFDSNIAGQIGGSRLSYRVGIGFEDFDLKSDAQFSRPAIGFNGNFQSKAQAHHGSYYGFATYRPTNWLNIAFGGRGYFANNVDIAPTRQISASIEAPESHHKFIAAYGQYGAVVLPIHSAFENIESAQSSQFSLDYKYLNDTTNFAFGIYQKIDEMGAVRTKISGFDLSYGYMIGENIEVSGTIARSLPYEVYNETRQRSENHLDYLVKLKTKFGLGGGRSLNFNYTAMSGSVYSLPVGTMPDRFGEPDPVYGRRNTEQLRDFQSLDVNYIQTIRFSDDFAPIGYININNLFDRTNQSDVRFNDTYTGHKFSKYLPRTIVVGMMIEF